jgi:hypothetical protein
LKGNCEGDDQRDWEEKKMGRRGYKGNVIEVAILVIEIMI